jgi:hypothetical protein
MGKVINMFDRVKEVKTKTEETNYNFDWVKKANEKRLERQRKAREEEAQYLATKVKYER